MPSLLSRLPPLLSRLPSLLSRLSLLLAGLAGSGLLGRVLLGGALLRLVLRAGLVLRALLGLVLLALSRLGLLGVLVVCHRVAVSTAAVRGSVRLPLLSAFPSLTPALLRRPAGLRRIRSRNFARQ